MKQTFFMYLFLSTILSCGGDTGNSDEFERQEEQLPEPETIQKVYRADIKSLNSSVVNNVKGQAVIRLEDTSFEVNLAVQNVPSVFHPQQIRTGKSCPTSADDVNRDGIIDLGEAEKVAGAVYVPLDNDLDQVTGDNLVYPNGGFVGAYVYREETSRENLVRELGPERDIEFENRVVMILGVAIDEVLPPTVTSPDGRPPQETLPIGCGEFSKVIGP